MMFPTFSRSASGSGCYSRSDGKYWQIRGRFKKYCWLSNLSLNFPHFAGFSVIGIEQRRDFWSEDLVRMNDHGHHTVLGYAHEGIKCLHVPRIFDGTMFRNLASQVLCGFDGILKTTTEMGEAVAHLG